MALYSAETPIEEIKTPDGELEDTEGGVNTWLQVARDAFEQADSYFDSSIRSKLQNAQAHFNNKHVPGSKYYSDSYRFRAKGFRPKSRSIVRKNEAAAAKAFFSTSDVVHIQAENEDDEAQRVSAEIMHSLLNYRLTKNIPWFTTLIGAYQDTLNAGICISHQTWEYAEEIEQKKLEGVVNMDGSQAVQEITHVLKDEPVVELRPPENVLFSASANWQDPINTSPFIIDKIPMHINEVEEMLSIEQANIPWYDISKEQLLTGITDSHDSIRSEREGSREDSKDQKFATSDFQTVWVYRYIVRRDGEDWLFYTLGTHHMLSEPVPLLDVYKHLKPGQRPYVLGFSVLETHKTYPSSLITLTEGLQQEANDINNQRRDNVALTLNKRYYARRGAKIDFASLKRNAPGSITLMDNVEQDVKTESPPDVTQSSYAEQDRVNMDYDELAGSFSTSSIASNRQLNETVGGMNMLQGDSNELVEYQIRLFAETWVEPVLRQVVQLEQAYEEDEALLKLQGEKLKLWQRYGLDTITDQWLQGTMTLEVNVGFGATNPQQRIEKLSIGLRTIAEFKPDLVMQMDGTELATEVMGALGFKGAKRFFPQMEDGEQDPQIAEMQQYIQQLEQQLQSKQMEIEGRTQVAQINADAKIASEQIKNEGKAMEVQVDAQTEEARIMIQREIDMIDRQLQHQKSEIERGKLINARDALLWKMRSETEQILSNPDNRQGTVIANDRYGMIPGQEG